MKRTRVCDIAASMLVLVLVTLTLLPALARIYRPESDTTCQGNLKTWAHALALYCADHGGRMPTNRAWGAGGIPGSLIDHVNLSTPGKVDAEGNPVRFEYGPNWVEALYPYVQQIHAPLDQRDQDWAAPWDPYVSRDAETRYFRCPNVIPLKTYPSGSTTARITYSLNFCLLEYWPQLTKRPGKLMMLREMDRLMNSTCRPSNDVTNSDAAPPKTPLLNNYSWRLKQTEPNRHANGSYIVFADGHVRWFSTDYFPEDSAYSNKALHWDDETRQWYNWVYRNPVDAKQRALDRSIAISP